MSANPPPRMTEAKYLAFERESEIKHEFYNGDVFAMSGATRRHNLAAGNTYAMLHTQLRGRPCETYMNGSQYPTPPGPT